MAADIRVGTPVEAGDLSVDMKTATGGATNATIKIYNRDTGQTVQEVAATPSDTKVISNEVWIPNTSGRTIPYGELTFSGGSGESQTAEGELIIVKKQIPAVVS